MIIQKVLFTPEECYRIKTATSSVYPPLEDKTWWASHKLNYRFKNKVEKATTDPTLLTFIADRVKEFGIKSIPSCKIIHYGKGGFFLPHIDSGRNHPIRRKTLLIQLSPADEYTGGDMFVGDTLFKKDLGNTIIFDSSITHELKIIDEGNRFVAVTWLSIYNLEDKKNLL